MKASRPKMPGKKIPNYKFLISYKVNGVPETVGCMTANERDLVLEAIANANDPDSRYKNKYTEVKLTKKIVFY